MVSCIGDPMMTVALKPLLFDHVIAGRPDSHQWSIWTPVTVQNKGAAGVTKTDPWKRKVLEAAVRAVVFLLSAGEVLRLSNLFRIGYFSGQYHLGMVGKGAVGYTLSHFPDARIKMINNKVHERVKVMPLDTFRDESGIHIEVAGGEMTFNGITAEIRRGFLNMYRVLTRRSLFSYPIATEPVSGEAGAAGTMRRNYV